MSDFLSLCIPIFPAQTIKFNCKITLIDRTLLNTKCEYNNILYGSNPIWLNFCTICMCLLCDDEADSFNPISSAKNNTKLGIYIDTLAIIRRRAVLALRLYDQVCDAYTRLKTVVYYRQCGHIIFDKFHLNSYAK